MPPECKSNRSMWLHLVAARSSALVRYCCSVVFLLLRYVTSTSSAQPPPALKQHTFGDSEARVHKQMLDKSGSPRAFSPQRICEPSSRKPVAGE